MKPNLYIEFIDERKDGIGRQVFFLGFEDPNVGGRIRFQVFNAILQTYTDKWVSRGYNVVFVYPADAGLCPVEQPPTIK